MVGTVVWTLSSREGGGGGRGGNCLIINMAVSAAAKNNFFKWVQPAVRLRLTYIKIFVLTSSLRKPMLTSWHFGADGNIWVKNMLFDHKMGKTENTLQNSRDPSMGHNFAWFIRTCPK